ncbi:aldose epimerase [Verrucomicrobia bacterium IMCC26134]|nr:aldose epimerase [Verrucomicrobia bacterium IMCC26134]
MPLRLLFLGLLSALTLPAAEPALPTVAFGCITDGREARLYTLHSTSGMEVQITDFGGIIASLKVPQPHGEPVNVILGLESAPAFEAKAQYFGALIGRYANRIAAGKFTLDGKSYTLTTNSVDGNVPVHLHGGKTGLNRVLWTAEPSTRNGQPALILRHLSHDGEEGYPGNLQIIVVYSVTADNALRIDYAATTDQPTPINLTSHCFFNLKGEGGGDILDHVVTINARRYTPLSPQKIPTGELATVDGTPFDFTQPHAIGERIKAEHPQLKLANGYDHNFVLDSEGKTLALAATVVEPRSGRKLEVLTTEPGMQLFTANGFSGKLSGRSGHPYVQHGALALETQHFPDSPNQPVFPTTILRPGETYRSTTVYKFSNE